MFSQNNEETKLDWMYKGSNSLVDREEYLLGRNIDKTLEQLNAEEKQKITNQLPQPKNHVEHECIPPSIRDYNKITLADQVDLAAKLQEDPLVAIRKREEETRKQFLQNPIQLKRLQKALKSQQQDNSKKKKSKKSKHKKSNKDIDAKLKEKLNELKNNPLGLGFALPNKKSSKETPDLDNALIHKFNKLKRKLTETDIKSILEGKETSDDDTSTDDESKDRKYKHSRQQGARERQSKREESYSDSEEETVSRRREKRQNNSNDRQHYPQRQDTSKNYNRYDDSSSDGGKKKNWGLVTHDGKKINLNRKQADKETKKRDIEKSNTTTSYKKSRMKLSEEEKEKRRREMMENATWRDKEREKNVKKYRDEDIKESKPIDYDPDFLHAQLVKATSSSTVESRIKSNLNNIQRSSSHMDKHFSRRN